MTKELKQDLTLAREIVSRCEDLFATESFHNNRHIAPALALAYEQLTPPTYGSRTRAAQKFGYSSVKKYKRAIEMLENTPIK